MQQFTHSDCYGLVAYQKLKVCGPHSALNRTLCLQVKSSCKQEAAFEIGPIVI